jgi:hypothetical protein
LTWSTRFAGDGSGETWFKRLTALIFYRVFRAMLGFDVVLDAGDFRLMSRSVILTMRSLREGHRFIRGLVGWIGFRQSSVTYTRHERFAGVTKYPLSKMLKFAFDGITSFSTLPLRMATWLGALAALLAMGLGAWAFYVKIEGTSAVPGWTTIMILVALGSSVQLSVIGILGAYVGRIYEEVQRRPLYTVAKEVNFAPGRHRDRAFPHVSLALLARRARGGVSAARAGVGVLGAETGSGAADRCGFPELGTRRGALARW